VTYTDNSQPDQINQECTRSTNRCVDAALFVAVYHNSRLLISGLRQSAVIQPLDPAC